MSAEREPSGNPARRTGDTDARREDPPWHVEGMREESGDQPSGPKRRPWWMTAAWLIAAYLIVFGLTSLLDRSDVVTISYTEFSAQVDAKNVKAIFARGDSIEGMLRAPVPRPGVTVAEGEQAPTYVEFQTERPTFADDDLLARLDAAGTTVSATPVVEDRGFLGNVLVSLARRPRCHRGRRRAPAMSPQRC